MRVAHGVDPYGRGFSYCHDLCHKDDLVLNRSPTVVSLWQQLWYILIVFAHG